MATKLDLLIRRSWGAREDNQAADFVFDTRLALAGAADVIAAALLKHVRLVAPRLHIPFVTPRIEVSATAAACGQFVEEKRAFKIAGGCRCRWGRFWAHGKRVGLVPKLAWRVKLVAELRLGEVTETEVARIERDKLAGTARRDLGNRRHSQLSGQSADEQSTAHAMVATGRRLAAAGSLRCLQRCARAQAQGGKRG